MSDVKKAKQGSLTEGLRDALTVVGEESGKTPL